MKKIVKAVLTLIYGIGVGCTVYFGIKFCMHSTYVINPDAMLPFMEYERAFCIMALGCPFMIASTISMIWAYGLHKAEHPKRKILLLSVPAVLDAIPFLFIILVLVIGLAKDVIRGW